MLRISPLRGRPADVQNLAVLSATRPALRYSALRVQWSCGPSGARVIRCCASHPFGAVLRTFRTSRFCQPLGQLSGILLYAFDGPADHQGRALFDATHLTPSGPSCGRSEPRGSVSHSASSPVFCSTRSMVLRTIRGARYSMLRISPLRGRPADVQNLAVLSATRPALRYSALRVRWSCGPSGARVIRCYASHPFGAVLRTFRTFRFCQPLGQLYKPVTSFFLASQQGPGAKEAVF